MVLRHRAETVAVDRQGQPELFPFGLRVAALEHQLAATTATGATARRALLAISCRRGQVPRPWNVSSPAPKLYVRSGRLAHRIAREKIRTKTSHYAETPGLSFLLTCGEAVTVGRMFQCESTTT